MISDWYFLCVFFIWSSNREVHNLWFRHFSYYLRKNKRKEDMAAKIKFTFNFFSFLSFFFMVKWMVSWVLKGLSMTCIKVATVDEHWLDASWIMWSACVGRIDKKVALWGTKIVLNGLKFCPIIFLWKWYG